MKNLTLGIIVLGGLFATGACNQSMADDIPCKTDAHCPTGYFCSSVGQCVDESASSPPLLEVVGVSESKDGTPKGSVTVARGKRLQPFYITLRNLGKSEAAYPKVKLAAASCLDIEGSLASNLIGILRTGDSATESVYVDPTADCPSPVQVDVTMEVGGGSVSPTRTFQGHFEVVLK